MNRIWIIPTGDEIRNGVVRDLDSPMIMSEMLRIWPMAEIVRTAPVYDEMQEILNMLLSAREDGADLTVLIGGSGGGHRFSPTLGKDFSHSAMDVFLEQGASREIYGKNGHLWCRLVCGRKGKMLVINLPGPYTEAKAAIQAFSAAVCETDDVAEINRVMAEAVFSQYPAGSAEL